MKKFYLYLRALACTLGALQHTIQHRPLNDLVDKESVSTMVTLIYLFRALKVTIQPFHHILVTATHDQVHHFTWSTALSLTGRCQHHHGSRSGSIKVVPIQPMLLISFLGPIPGHASIHLSSLDPLKLQYLMQTLYHDHNTCMYLQGPMHP